MPRGKKYNAAEKHFMVKEADYQKRLKDMSNDLATMHSERLAMRTKIQELERENAALHEWVNKLLSYTELPLEDIKKVCEQDKRRGEALTTLLNPAFKMIGGYLV